MVDVGVRDWLFEHWKPVLVVAVLLMVVVWFFVGLKLGGSMSCNAGGGKVFEGRCVNLSGLGLCRDVEDRVYIESVPVLPVT